MPTDAFLLREYADQNYKVSIWNVNLNGPSSGSEILSTRTGRRFMWITLIFPRFGAKASFFVGGKPKVGMEIVLPTHDLPDKQTSNFGFYSFSDQDTPGTIEGEVWLTNNQFDPIFGNIGEVYCECD